MEEIRRVPGTFGDPVRVIQKQVRLVLHLEPEHSSLEEQPRGFCCVCRWDRTPLIYHIGGYVLF